MMRMRSLVPNDLRAKNDLRDVLLVDTLFSFPSAFAPHPGAALAAKLI
jgi:hypothetical protein